MNLPFSGWLAQTAAPLRRQYQIVIANVEPDPEHLARDGDWHELSDISTWALAWA